MQLATMVQGSSTCPVLLSLVKPSLCCKESQKIRCLIWWNRMIVEGSFVRMKAGWCISLMC